MYKDLNNSPFYKSSRETSVSSYGNRAEIDPEVRYGFESGTKNYVQNSLFDFQSAENNDWGYRPKQKQAQSKFTLKDYDEEHFFKHEEECEVCDYIEVFQNLNIQKFKELFVFSEVIGKPKALRK